MKTLNSLCLACAQDCKQRSFVKIISCNFRAKSLTEKVNQEPINEEVNAY